KIRIMLGLTEAVPNSPSGARKRGTQMQPNHTPTLHPTFAKEDDQRRARTNPSNDHLLLRFPFTLIYSQKKIANSARPTPATWRSSFTNPPYPTPIFSPKPTGRQGRACTPNRWHPLPHNPSPCHPFT